VTNGAPTWGTSQAVTTPVMIGAPSSDDAVRPVVTEQLTSIPEAPQPRRQPKISLWEESADQPVDFSTAAVAVSVGRLDFDAGGQYQQRSSSYVAQPSHVAPPQYEHHSQPQPAQHPSHTQHPSHLSSLQRPPDRQHVAPDYAQPETESLDVFVDAPKSINASIPATVEAPPGASDATAAIKPKRGRSNSRHHRRRSSSFSSSSSPELRRRHYIKLHELNGDTPFEDFWVDYLNCLENNG